MTQPVKQNEEIEVEIEHINSQGDGIARIDGFVIFVPKAIPEEKVKIKITTLKKDYAIGEIINIKHESIYRTRPKCKHYLICGGCQLQHVKYRHQLELKKRIVIDALTRIGKQKANKVKEVIASSKIWEYRNKVAIPVAKSYKGIITGFYKKNTHTIVPISYCPIQHPILNKIYKSSYKFMKEYKAEGYDEKTGKGLIRHLIIRCGENTKEALLCFVTTGIRPPIKRLAHQLLQVNKELVGVWANINKSRTNEILGQENIHLNGREAIRETINNFIFKIKHNTFFQVNSQVAALLFEKIAEYVVLLKGKNVLELYSGAGSITLHIAPHVRSVTAVEEVEEAVNLAKINAKANMIGNVRFIHAKAEDRSWPDENYDTIILDPPRAGCHIDVLEYIIQKRIPHVIYVSCNPTTLARDILTLSENGYNLVEIQPFDMFPHTCHVECVAILNLLH